MKTSSVKRKTKQRTYKVCKRCKTTEGFPSKENSLCITCQSTCVKCNNKLTPNNYNQIDSVKYHSYRCISCSNASVIKNRDPVRQRNSYLQRTYGISSFEYSQMEENQNQCCAICKKPNSKNKKLHVDHKHTKGEKKLKVDKRKPLIRSNVRGLLCWQCNRAISMFRDSPIELRNAAEYLENWPSKKVLKDLNEN